MIVCFTKKGGSCKWGVF